MYSPADHFLADDEEQLAEGIKNSGAPAVNLALGRVVPRLERRARVRVRATLPVKVTIGEDEERIGETVNFSAKGILFDFPQGLKIGTAVKLVLHVPRNLSASEDVRLDCHGRVLRLESSQRSGDFGIAVATEDYKLLPV